MGIPDHAQFFGDLKLRNWKGTVYDHATEEIPPNAPPPKGKPCRQSVWWDANLLHDLWNRRSAMGTVHMVNQAPVHWSSTRQSTVETSTYASEIITYRVCFDEIVAIR